VNDIRGWICPCRKPPVPVRSTCSREPVASSQSRHSSRIGWILRKRAAGARAGHHPHGWPAPEAKPRSVDDGRFNDVARHEGRGESASSCATTAQTDEYRAAVTRRRAAGCLVALPVGHRASRVRRTDHQGRQLAWEHSRAGWGRGLAEERRVPGQKIGAGAHRVSYLCATRPPA
jgi:hypothetical protein